MASVEESIYTKLQATSAVTALVSTRVYPIVAPQGAALPYITYQKIAGNTVNNLSGADATSNGLYQIDCWAASYSGVKALADSVRSAMNGWFNTGGTPRIDGSFLQNETDLPDMPGDGGDEPTHRVSMDFSIWFA